MPDALVLRTRVPCVCRLPSTSLSVACVPLPTERLSTGGDVAVGKAPPPHLSTKMTLVAAAVARRGVPNTPRSTVRVVEVGTAVTSMASLAVAVAVPPAPLATTVEGSAAPVAAKKMISPTTTWGVLIVGAAVRVMVVVVKSAKFALSDKVVLRKPSKKATGFWSAPAKKPVPVPQPSCVLPSSVRSLAFLRGGSGLWIRLSNSELTR
mmetsp:Transcript_17429/g.34159  ORF Transcript_17429/g.34159 Transcript_17429/m.34159 type:complete len:208 (-) Transcript_17429:1371-1994(-)